MNCHFENDYFLFMSSPSSNIPIILPPSNGSLTLPKIAAPNTDTIDRHLARIVTGNAGMFVYIMLLFVNK